MVRELQPGVIIDNRLGGQRSRYGSMATGNPKPYHGDFQIPEQIIPPEESKMNGMTFTGSPRMMMNGNWGYHATDNFWKPSPMLIKKLVECVSKGGNLILNVGPDAKGNIPDASQKILSEIGTWMKKNKNSIYGCGKAGLPKPDNGRLTRNGNKLYYHLYENTIGPMTLMGIKKDEVKCIRYLATGAEVPISTSWVHTTIRTSYLQIWVRTDPPGWCGYGS